MRCCGNERGGVHRQLIIEQTTTNCQSCDTTLTQAQLLGGKLLPLLPLDLPGIPESKWCANRFHPFLCIDPQPDPSPPPRDAEEFMEVCVEIPCSKSCELYTHILAGAAHGSGGCQAHCHVRQHAATICGDHVYGHRSPHGAGHALNKDEEPTSIYTKPSALKFHCFSIGVFLGEKHSICTRRQRCSSASTSSTATHPSTWWARNHVST